MPKPGPVTEEKKQTVAAAFATPVDNNPKVAAIAGDKVYLTIGSQEGVKVGDLVMVVLETLEIKHPDTGAILDYKVLDSMVLRVVVASKTAECSAYTQADKSKMDKLKPGLAIKRLARPQPPKPVSKPPVKPQAKKPVIKKKR